MSDSEPPARDLSNRVIGFAIEVHRHLGPGLLESVYEECLCQELAQAAIPFDRQVQLPIIYKGNRLDGGFRLDIVVNGSIIIELKSVERLLPIHEAQILTYLRLSRIGVGLLMNFNEPILKTGIRRFAM